MMLIALAIVAVVLIAYFLSLKPGKPRRAGFHAFEDTLIAHRGYFDKEKGIPENSLSAYKRAVECGYGIELDVQITRDDVLVCFHDEDLKRMCGISGHLTNFSYDKLMALTLSKTKERIPTFEEAFNVFRDRVPVIIEIKAHGNYIKTVEKLMTYLDGYKGDFLVESFHPGLVRWLKKNRPEILRGQLSTVFKPKNGVPWIARFIATNLLTNFLTAPDFVAYDFHHKSQFSFRLMRLLYKVENVAWTIRSKEDMEKARDVFNIFIFDSFDPREASHS